MTMHTAPTLPLPRATRRPWRQPAVAAALAALALAGCSTTSPDVISRSEAQRLATVSDAVVLSVRNVTVDGSQSGVGAATGAVVGGVAGSSVGGSREAVAVGVLGAVVGGVIGNVAERAATREDALEILVQLKNGERRSIVQARGSEALAPGDAVLLVNSGGKVRVTKAPALTPSVPATAPAHPPATASPG